MKQKWRLLVIVLFLMSFASASYAAGQGELELLGKLIFNNKKLSINRNQSCQTCHHPRAAFADPANLMDPIGFPVSEGSNPGDFGNRNAPSAAYAGFSPRFHWDGELFIKRVGRPGIVQRRFSPTTGCCRSGPGGYEKRRHVLSVPLD